MSDKIRHPLSDNDAVLSLPSCRASALYVIVNLTVLSRCFVCNCTFQLLGCKHAPCFKGVISTPVHRGCVCAYKGAALHPSFPGALVHSCGVRMHRLIDRPAYISTPDLMDLVFSLLLRRGKVRRAYSAYPVTMSILLKVLRTTCRE